jgi:hypothetical protein
MERHGQHSVTGMCGKRPGGDALSTLARNRSMTTVAERKEVAGLFDDFVRVFGTFDGREVAKLFTAPGVALKRDGTLKGFSTHDEVEDYYQAALDRYAVMGCQSCRYDALELRDISEQSLMATVSWDLLGPNDAVISHWRQAYMILRVEGSLRIYASAFVAD